MFYYSKISMGLYFNTRIKLHSQVLGKVSRDIHGILCCAGILKIQHKTLCVRNCTLFTWSQVKQIKFVIIHADSLYTSSTYSWMLHYCHLNFFKEYFLIVQLFIIQNIKNLWNDESKILFCSFNYIFIYLNYFGFAFALVHLNVVWTLDH